MVKYSRKKVKKEMNKLISSPQLRKQAADISPESFETFLYVDVNREHQRHAPFTRALLRICVDGSDTIINDPNAIDNKNVPLCNNMTEPPLLED